MINPAVFEEARRASDYITQYCLLDINYSRDAIGMALIQIGTAMLATDNPKLYAYTVAGILEAMAEKAYGGGKK